MSQSTPVATKKPTPLLSDGVYTALKHIAAVGLPALSTLYFALASIWNWPDTTAVVGSIAAVNVFAGAFMTLSSVTYNSTITKYVGDLLYHKGGSVPELSLSLDGAVQDIEKLGQVLLKVVPTNAAPPTTSVPPVPPVA